MNNTKDHPIRVLTLSALFAALVFVFTAFIRIPGPLGYMHLGDGCIFLASDALGPVSAIPAVLGSILADFAAGYPVYIPVTAVIKALIALLGAFARKKPFFPRLLILLGAELIMVAGYCLFEFLLYGWGNAIAAVPFNLVQGALGVVFALLLQPLFDSLLSRLRFKI